MTQNKTKIEDLSLDSLKLIFSGKNSLVYYREADNSTPALIIKRLKSEFPDTAQLTQFNNEIKFTSTPVAKEIRKTYSYGKIAGRDALAMEYFDGERLTDFFKKNREKGIEFFLKVAVKLASVLEKIHKHNIIHRDINGNNILINPKGEVKLIDFGISTNIDLKVFHQQSPTALDGTLSNISPEQTGRMNRPVDYRSDLYSLGISFYQMLTGYFPFESSDPLELVYSHIAKYPNSPSNIDSKIPAILSEIVLKLLEKNADDRYQSAYGLRKDLEHCLKSWEENKVINWFKLGENDFSGKFKSRQTLYGRDKELKILEDAFNNTVKGRAELLMVSGYSGVGKSSLIYELHKRIAEKKGYFVSGKYDQLQKDTPFSTLIIALTELINYLLGESEETLKDWKKKILSALGTSGQVLIDVIPALELIIGSQPPTAELDPAESANRFNYLFQTLLKTLSSKEHPLVIFLDDLQWADFASLNLIKNLIKDDSSTCVLLIGAYRNNEVDSSHPLEMTLSSLKRDKAPVIEIELDNLSFSDVTKIILETLSSKAEEVKELVKIVYSKTNGNPFFVNQFGESLYSKGLLKFDSDQRKWIWDIEKILQENITNNVVDLMVERLTNLPDDNIKAICYAGCIGNIFSLDLLTSLYFFAENKKENNKISQYKQQLKIIQLLWKTIEDGIIIPLDSNYELLSYVHKGQEIPKIRFKFLHDKVQQAAYSLIDNEQKNIIHLRLGKLLLTSVEDINSPGDLVFDIINQYNQSSDLVTDLKERTVLAKLNLEAAKRAISSIAYHSALNYLLKGANYLDETGWDTEENLTFEIYLTLAESYYLMNNFEQSKGLVKLLLERVKQPVKRAKVYNLLIVQNTMSANYLEAIEAGRKALALLNVELPDSDFVSKIEQEQQEIQANLANRKVSDLVNMPKMSDTNSSFAMKLLNRLSSPAYFASPELWVIVAMKRVNLSLKYGNAAESAYGYTNYGIWLGSQGDYQIGYEFGELGLKISENWNDLSQKCRASLDLSNFIGCWVKHLRSFQKINYAGYQSGLASGELQYTGYILKFRLFNPFHQGRNLEYILEKAKKFLHFNRKVGNQSAIDTILGCLLVTKNLTSETNDYSSFDADIMLEDDYLLECDKKQSNYALCNFLILKAQALYLYGEPAIALELLEKSQKLLPFVAGTFVLAVANFFHSLSLLAVIPTLDEEKGAEYLKKVETNQARLKKWSDNCEDNFLHKYLLVEAEIHKIKNEFWQAQKLYLRSIKSAAQYGFIQNEALSNELIANFFMENEEREYAAIHFKKARYCYQTWGASRKVEQLNKLHSNLFNEFSSFIHMEGDESWNTSTTESHSGTELDIESMLRFSQALSGEVKLAKLLTKTIRILIENAGATRGVLIKVESDQMLIEADGNNKNSTIEVLKSKKISENLLPLNVINYAFNTRETFILNDVFKDPHYSLDSYIQKNKPKSLLCLPIMQHGEILAILYLENDLSINAFTRKQIELLNVLTAQITISIENADLYSKLEQKVKKRTAKLREANKEITLLNELLKEENLRMGAELDVTRRLQEMLLPKDQELKTIEGLDISSYMKPAEEVGGDYYDVLRTGERTLIGIGDVTGHGLESGLLMLMTQTAIRMLLNSGEKKLPSFLKVLNKTIYDNLLRMGIDKTISLSLLEYKDGQLKLSGQHEYLIIVRKDKTIELVDTIDFGFPIGLDKNIDHLFTEANFSLAAGDCAVLFTDGITEAENPNGEMYGLERLSQAIKNNVLLEADKIKDAIVEDFMLFTNKKKAYDDQTLLILKKED